MNLFHGLVAAFYLTKLVTDVPQQHRGIVFGLGYGIGSISSWLLSLIGNGNFLQSNYVLICYVILVMCSIVLLIRTQPTSTNLSCAKDDSHSTSFSSSFLFLAGITFSLLSLVKNSGFYFPMADIASGSISLELRFFGLSATSSLDFS